MIRGSTTPWRPCSCAPSVRGQARRQIERRAADDRARAAADREDAARERIRALRAQGEARTNLLLAATDELTGVWTRRLGLANITREIERTARTKSGLVLAFIDVDGLKEVNDTQGHLEGDRLLRFVADTVKANVRPYDVVVRYGGDEFLCAMPNLAVTRARERMEKIAATLAAEDARHSIAFGLAEYVPGDQLDDLVDRANKAFREVKHPGYGDEQP